MPHADFLKLILADPEADGPRLIYADWLDEHGDSARAEFIRVQCARARLPADDPRWPQLGEREQVLLEQNRLAWSAPLSGLATSWEFVRGFPDRVRVEAGVFLERADSIFGAPIRHIEIHDVRSDMARIARSPHLARLTGLRIIAAHQRDSVLRTLSQSGHVGQLRHLYLGRNRIGDDGAAALAASPNFHSLVTLDLGDNEIGPAGVAALAASPVVSSVQTLLLNGNPVQSAGAESILASTKFSQLRNLNLAQCGVGFAAMEALADNSGAARLSQLDLSGNDLGDAGANSLARWTGVMILRDLDLSRNDIGDPGALSLAESPRLAGLRRLALNGNRITEVGKRALTFSPSLQRLTALELRENWSPLAVLRRLESTMPRDADFLNAVLADPDADGPRLVFADWLEETGQESRAEFIRLQCAIADLPETEHEYHPLVAREAELWHAHRDEWVRPLDETLFPDGTADWFAPVRAVAELAGSVLGFGRPDNFVHQFVHLLAADRWTFRRGFAEKLRAGAADYLRAANALEKATPLRSLTVNLSDGDSCESLAACPQLGRLQSLRVYSGATSNVDAQPLLEAHLPQLRRLGLHHMHLSSHEMMAFADSTLLRQLDDLELSVTGANVASRRAFVASPAVAAKSRLALQEFWAVEHAADFITAWPECPNLADLDLAGTGLGDIDLGPILDRSPKLRELNLAGTQIADGALRSLMRSPRLRQLSRLNLSNNAFGDQSILDLLDSPNLLATTRLILRDAGLHPRVQEAVRTRLGDRVVV